MRDGKDISAALRQGRKVGRPRKIQSDTQVMRMRELGWSHARIAADLKCSESAVRRAIARAMEMKRGQG